MVHLHTVSSSQGCRNSRNKTTCSGGPWSWPLLKPPRLSPRLNPPLPPPPPQLPPLGAGLGTVDEGDSLDGPEYEEEEVAIPLTAPPTNQ